MSRTRLLTALLLLAALPAGAAETEPTSPAGGAVSGEVRAALQDALEAHATPPTELPRLPDATTPATPGHPDALGKGVREQAAAHASARAREVLEQLRLGQAPGRAERPGREVEAAAAQDRAKKARHQGPGTDPGKPTSPGNNGSHPLETTRP